MTIIEELEAVLEAEQKFLLEGDFAGLKALTERKTKLAERLAKDRPDVPESVYRQLAEKAGHNEALLNSARRGLQAAMAQIRQAAQSAEQTTYSKSRERRPLSRRPGSVTQKA